MEIKEFQELSKRTMPKVGSKVNAYGDTLVMSKPMIVSNYAQGLAGEAGEVCDGLKKVVYHGHNLDVDDLEKELGDIMHYVVGLATLNGISMENVLDKNIEKLRKRFPEGFNTVASIERVDVKNKRRYD